MLQVGDGAEDSFAGVQGGLGVAVTAERGEVFFKEAHDAAPLSVARSRRARMSGR